MEVRLREHIFKVLGVLVVIIVWAGFSYYSGEYLFPSPVTVFKDVITIFITGEIVNPVYFTFLRVLGALLLTLSLGIGIGILAGRNVVGDYLTRVILVVLMTTPSLVIVLASVMILGPKDYVPALAAAAVVFPFTSTVMRDVMKSLSPELLEMAKSFGASLRHMVRDIYIPHLMPAILAQSRVAYAHCWKIVLLTEVFGMSEGVGYNVKIYFYNYQLDMVVAWVVIFLIVVLIVEEVLRIIEKRATAWRGR